MFSYLCFVIRFLLTLSLLVGMAYAYTIPPRPVNSYVLDEPDLLSAQQEQGFNQLAEALYRKANFSLAIAVIQDIGPEDYRDVAVNLGTAWGLGSKESSEAALIFVAVTQKKRSIEVGYGSEDYLTDLETNQIQQQIMVPAFRKGRFDLGLLGAAQAIAQKVAIGKNIPLDSILTSASLLQQMGTAPQNESSRSIVSFLMKHPFIFLILIFLLLGRGRRGAHVGTGMAGFGGGFGGISSGHSRSGGGGSGGGSFGGGFGGGSFGGGGSGGSW